MKTLRIYGDGYGTVTTIKHDDLQSGALYIRHERSDLDIPAFACTFLPQELEELSQLFADAAAFNREHGLFPYKGKTAVIEGMEVHIKEPTNGAYAGETK